MEENFLSGVTDDILGFVRENPIGSAVGAGVIATGVIGSAIAISGAKSSRRNKRASTKKGRSRDRKFKSKQKHEQRYKRKGKYKVYQSKKAKLRHKKGILYTKNKQPYIILANGRARFIKKK